MASNIKVQKICQQCGKEFTARTTVTRCCGDACAKKAYKEGFDTGYACGCVFYHCSACGKLIKMSSDAERQAAAKYMEEHGWKHETCES